MSVLQSVVAPVEGRLRGHGVPGPPSISPDRLKTAKALVEKAVKMRKVFSVQGPYPVIRSALWARGWVERRLPQPTQRAAHGDGDEEPEGDVDAADRVDEGERDENLDDMYDLMSRLVRNEKTYFYWTTRRDYVDCRALRSDQMTNHYANAGTFTTKVGLCMNLRNLQWFDTADPDTFFPRCYRLGAEDERRAFIEDFRRTACSSLLQHVVESKRKQGAELERQKSQNAPPAEPKKGEPHSVGPGVINTALRVCQEFLDVLEHGDIDLTPGTPPSVEEQQWAEFLHEYYMVVHDGALIRGSSAFVERCNSMLVRLREVCPQLDTDGVNNIWIIKPGAMSRGRGIMCMNRLEDILTLVDNDRSLTKESKWVVQKYLERPLLINGTKFDVRQWFLVTDWNPLTVWFYRECYLRFSTQPYSTKILDSSVHLCNNSIQKHLQPSCERHPAVPKDNMWSCAQFRAYLQRQGRGPEWESVVVPGMQQAVVRALQTAQELVEPRKASFELYGADFMLDRKLRPWLLEINAGPTMACSTSVTARLCPAVQLDTLRVVLDRRTDPAAYTGGFQLIHKQNCYAGSCGGRGKSFDYCQLLQGLGQKAFCSSYDYGTENAVEVPQYVGVNLLVEGAPIRRPRPSLQRQLNEPLALQPASPSEEPERAHKSCTIEGFRLSGKKAHGEKKRQLTSASPKREDEGRTTIPMASCARRAHRNLLSKKPLAAHTEPQRKARRLGLSLAGAAVVPRSLSFSLCSPHAVLSCKTDSNKAAPGSHLSRSFLPQIASETQHTNSARVFSSIQGQQLPVLEVFSLHPSVLAKTANPTPSSHSSPHKRYKVKCKRRCVKEETQQTT